MEEVDERFVLLHLISAILKSRPVIVCAYIINVRGLTAMDARHCVLCT